MAKKNIKSERNKSKKYRIAIFIGIGLLIILVSFYINRPEKKIFTPTYTILPTPTLTIGQKAIYTFYIKASSQNTSSTVTLKKSDSGKTFTVDIGSLIFLHFGIGNYQVSTTSPQDIILKGTSNLPPNYQYRKLHGLPSNDIEALEIVRPGIGTITVTETK